MINNNGFRNTFYYWLAKILNWTTKNELVKLTWPHKIYSFLKNALIEDDFYSKPFNNW